jgi:predicted RNase H-like HicB family nuclease
MVKKKVTIVLFHDDEAGGYSVIIPTVPQLVTMGDTVEEAFSMAKECLKLNLQEATDWDHFDLDHAYSEHVVVGTVEVEVPPPSESKNIRRGIQGPAK